MSKFAMFARLTKVDEAKRQITGVIADETVDGDNEVFDYASSKPNIEKWSNAVAKASGGASVGNVRAMHSKVAAGKLDEIVFDDTAKSVSVTATIVDDAEWNKVQKAVYTGFSIGGSYGKKWDDNGVKRYTAIPSEVSLADVPCNPNSTFTVLKVDGTSELRKFAGAATTDASGSDGSNTPPSNSDTGDAAPAVVSQADYDEVMKAIDALEGADSLKKMLRDYVGNSLKVEQSTADLCELEKVCASIVERAAKDEKLAGIITDMFRYDGRPELAKDMCSASNLCSLFERLGWARDGARYEAQFEGDNSKVPGMLDNVLRALGDAAIAMVKEEVAETIAKTDTPTTDVLDKSTSSYGVALRKAMGLAEDVDDDAVVAGIQKMVAEKDTFADSLRKHHKQIEELNSAATALNKKLQAQNEELETLRKAAKQPEDDPKAPRLRVVNKGEDLAANNEGESVEKVKTADGKTDDAATLIKMAHARGGKPLIPTASAPR